jgi:hypothetical protein
MLSAKMCKLDFKEVSCCTSAWNNDKNMELVYIHAHTNAGVPGFHPGFSVGWENDACRAMPF